jgi:hypothetical protein
MVTTGSIAASRSPHQALDARRETSGFTFLSMAYIGSEPVFLAAAGIAPGDAISRQLHAAFATILMGLPPTSRRAAPGAG